jgi:molecular chaperone HtpG
VSITDNGIGMSRKELVANLGTIAKSGTADFLSKRTGDEKKDAQLIGQFGVGFYSAFIVADKVTVETRRAGKKSSSAHRWQSKGEGKFTIEDIDRVARGTTITLHLKSTETEFSEKLRIETLIRKYSDHIAFPVELNDEMNKEDDVKVINSATALWNRSRNEVTDDEYKEFYKHIAHDFSDPVQWSHNRVEGKREYTSLLYIPSRAPFDLWNREAPKGLKLYVKRVFIMDDAEQFLPLYLRFVKGVIDASDLPLNVSRELLQKNPEIDAIKAALTKRVLDILNKLAGKEAEEDQKIYENLWREFGAVIKEGFVEETKNSEKLIKLLRFSSTKSPSSEQTRTISQYLNDTKKDQDKIYYLLADNYAAAKSNPHLEQLEKRGIEVLFFTDRIDPWMADHLPEYEGKKFQDVGRGKIDLPKDENALDQDTINSQHENLIKNMKMSLEDRVESINISQRLVESAACVVSNEQDLPPQMRRMMEASGQQMPDSKPILEINVQHDLIKTLSDTNDNDAYNSLANTILDHALIADGEQLQNPAEYVKRVNSLLLQTFQTNETTKKKTTKKKTTKKKTTKKKTT